MNEYPSENEVLELIQKRNALAKQLMATEASIRNAEAEIRSPFLKHIQKLTVAKEQHVPKVPTTVFIIAENSEIRVSCSDFNGGYVIFPYKAIIEPELADQIVNIEVEKHYTERFEIYEKQAKALLSKAEEVKNAILNFKSTVE